MTDLEYWEMLAILINHDEAESARLLARLFCDLDIEPLPSER